MHSVIPLYLGTGRCCAEMMTYVRVVCACEEILIMVHIQCGSEHAAPLLTSEGLTSQQLRKEASMMVYRTDIYERYNA
jgi:hypothetical protein